jgi:hypothetical protein
LAAPRLNFEEKFNRIIEAQKSGDRGTSGDLGHSRSGVSYLFCNSNREPTIGSGIWGDKEFYSKKKNVLIEDIKKIKLNIEKDSDQEDAFAGRRGSGWAQNISRNSAYKQVRKSKRTYSINDINTNSRNLSRNANTTSHLANNYSSLAQKNISPDKGGLNRP